MAYRTGRENTADPPCRSYVWKIYAVYTVAVYINRIGCAEAELLKLDFKTTNKP